LYTSAFITITTVFTLKMWSLKTLELPRCFSYVKQLSRTNKVITNNDKCNMEESDKSNEGKQEVTD